MSCKVVLIMEFTFYAFYYLDRWFSNKLTTLKQRVWKLKRWGFLIGFFSYLATNQFIREIRLLSLFVSMR